MICQICGCPDAERKPDKLLRLCKGCDASTPDKVPQPVFDMLYWAGHSPKPKERIRKEFYEDYLTSDLDFGGYLEATLSAEL